MPKRMLLLLFLVACAHREPAYVFSTPAGLLSSEIVRAVRKIGLHPVAVTGSSVETAWIDTGLREAGPAPAKGARENLVLRRFVVTFKDKGKRNEVGVRTDMWRCTEGTYVIMGTRLEGTCERLAPVDAVSRKALDEVGARLRSALAS